MDQESSPAAQELLPGDDGWLQDFDDDPSLRYEDKAPIGYRLKEQLAANEELTIREGISRAYAREKETIADPSDYYTSQPDVEIRWHV